MSNQNGSGSPVSGCLTVTDTTNDAVSSKTSDGVTFSESTEAAHVAPSASDSALEMMDSSSLSDNCLIDGATVKPSVNFVGRCIGRLTSVFPLNGNAQCPEMTIEVYANLLVGYSDEQVGAAFTACAKKLTRMPYPADLILAIEGKE